MSFGVKRVFNQGFAYLLICSSAFFFSCRSSYIFTEIQGDKIALTSVYDVHPNAEATALLTPYKTKKDSIMNAVIGKSEKELIPYRPESPLSNLSADMLREAAFQYTGIQMDISVTNMGGLRNRLPEGEITIGAVYEVFPFENHLCILTLDGVILRKLFQQIISRGGEGISGARLVGDENLTLLSALVDGKEIDPNAVYKVATLDYLAEGNDGLGAFCEAKEKDCFPQATIRELMLEYVEKLTKEGRLIDASTDGRIIIE